MSASLPPSPSLEQLRKQAKDLLRLHHSGDPAAVARVAAGHPGPREPLKLSAAQLVIAREHGFSGWPALRLTSPVCATAASPSRVPTGRSRLTISTACARCSIASRSW